MKMPFRMSDSKRPRLAWVALLAAALGAAADGQAAAGPVVYVAGSSNEFGTLDLNTGNFNLIGQFPTGRRGQFPIFGLGFTGPGQLDAVDARGNVFAVDPTNATVTPLFSTGTFPNGGGGGNGNMYIFDSSTGNVDVLNINNRTVNTLANFPNTQSTGFTAVGPDGSLYVTVYNSNPGGGPSDDLYRINLLTGAMTDIGPDLNSLYAGVFVGPMLYGFGPSGGIYTVNTTTGQETFMGAYLLPGGDSIYAAAFQGQSVPEPSSLILLAGGMACVAGLFPRRRR